MSNAYQYLELNSPLNKFSDKLIQMYRKIKGFNAPDPRLISIVNTLNGSDVTFLSDRDSYLTFFYIDGLGSDPTLDTVQDVSSSLNQYLSRFIMAGHLFHDCISTYQDNIEERLQHIKRGRQESAESLGMSVKNTDKALINMVKKNVFFEERVICLETPNLIDLYIINGSNVEAKLGNVPLTEEYKKSISQGLGDKLLEPHLLFVEQFTNFINDPLTQIEGRPLDVDHALSYMKVFTDPKTFKTDLMSNKTPNLSPTKGGNPADSQLDDFLGKDFQSALFNERPTLHPNDSTIVKVGSRIYKSVVVDRYSLEFISYNSLHSKLIEKKIPYRMKTSIGKNPVVMLNHEYQASKFTVLPNQRKFKDAYDTLYHYTKSNCIPMLQQGFTTWVDGDDEKARKLLNKKAEELLSAVMSWSGGGLSNKAHIETVTPLHTFYSTLPCTIRSTAPFIPVPLKDICQKLPMYRPSFPFHRAGNTFVTSKDGKIMNFDSFDGRTSYITYICGSMGTGKSVLFMHLRNDLLFRRTNNGLPYQINIDIGGNLQTDTELYRSESPDLASKIHYLIVNNDPNNKNSARINIFSTPLGLRKLPSNMLEAVTSLLTDRVNGQSGSEMPQSTEMIKSCTKMVFDRLAHPSSAKRINLDVIPGLKATLRNYGFLFKASSTQGEFKEEPEYVGWNIVDFLIGHDEIDLAYRVQNLCVPTLSDFLSTVNDSSWQKQWSQEINGIVLGEVFALKIRSLIDSYPFISQASTFNIWDKHILTFELSEVLQRGGSGDAFQARFWYSLVFLYIRGLLGVEPESIEKYTQQIRYENDYRDVEGVKHAEKIVSYQKEKIAHITSSKKRAAIDEIHRMLPTESGNSDYGYGIDIIDSTLNEIRRSRIEMAFASPEPAHGRYFNKKASLIMLLGFTSRESLESCREHFGLSDYEIEAYVSKLRLDPKKGVNSYLILKEVSEISNVKEFKHVVYFPIPMIEIWRYANTSIEKNIRNKVTEKYGVDNGLLILSGALPGAGNSKDLEMIENRLLNNGVFDDFSEMSAQENAEKKSLLIADTVLKMIDENTDYYINLGLKAINGD
ncbi:hypothetical protein [Marinomonas sp. 2405UD68-3]|uniref:hypothetical protein n=1 Tax=Marinomonas sp. 2405UD68-3 TaxID=3391835 RepID=UPI0039C9C04D